MSRSNPQGRLVRAIKKVPRLVRGLLRHRVPARHAVDYATHVPILVGLGCLLKVSRVLEFGSGFYSTVTFLNRSVFPSVTSVCSIESDPDWISKVYAATKDDSRLIIRHAPEPIEAILAELNLNEYDLVLVDSSTEAIRRAAVIREIAIRDTGSGLVVIHDFEIDLYRKATKGFANRIEFAAFNPCTGIVWRGDGDRRKVLGKIKEIVNRNAANLSPEDVGSWVAVFHKELRGHGLGNGQLTESSGG